MKGFKAYKVIQIFAIIVEVVFLRAKNKVIMPKTFNTESLGNLIVKKSIVNENILLPRSQLGHDEFVTKLQSAGLQVKEIDIYKTVIPKKSKTISNEIFQDRIDIATFTSSSTVNGLVDLLGGINQLKDVNIASIGPVTQAAVEKVGLSSNILASESTVESLVEAIKAHFAK